MAYPPPGDWAGSPRSSSPTMSADKILEWRDLFQALGVAITVFGGGWGVVWRLRTWIQTENQATRDVLQQENKDMQAFMQKQWDEIRKELRDLSNANTQTRETLAGVRTAQEGTDREVLRLRDQSRSHEAQLAELRGLLGRHSPEQAK